MNDIEKLISKFKTFVLFMAIQSEGMNQHAVIEFEDAIERTGNERPCFGIAGSDYDRIDFMIPWKVKSYDEVFYCEYDNGRQAPFVVCEWKKSFDELELLLKDTSEELYQAYMEYAYSKSLENQNEEYER